MAEHDNIVIDVQNLQKNFAGKPAVRGIDLQLRRGEIFGFLGPNGSGKTTTLRMLCGLLIPDAGTGHCLGFDIKAQAAAIKQRVGYMTQRFSLYEDLSVEENLRFIAEIYQMENVTSQIEQVLQQLAFGDRRYQLAGTLSGGWKQRLALACALIHQPQLLLLDEPTAGVDPKARRDFWDHIHYLSQQGVTSLVSTHYMDEAERCHRLAFIAHGRLLVQGTLADIITHTQLKTWEVSGDCVFDVIANVKSLAGIEQATAFGTNVHISGTEATVLAHSIKQVQPQFPHLQWREISPGLEDIFINLSVLAQGIAHEED